MAKQILAAGSAGPTLHDNVLKHLVKCARRAPEADVGRQREKAQDARPVQRIQKVFHDHVERIAHLPGLLQRIHAEQRFGDDFQGQMHHRFMQMKLLAVAPGMQHALGMRDHDGTILLHARHLKGWLRQAALAAPEVAVAGQQTLAEHAFQQARVVVLAEVGVIAAQDDFDVVRVEKEVVLHAQQTRAHDIAVTLLAGRNEPQRIAQVGKIAADQGDQSGSRRT